MARIGSLLSITLLALLGCGDNVETRRPAPPGGADLTDSGGLPDGGPGPGDGSAPAADKGQTDVPLPEGMGLPCQGHDDCAAGQWCVPGPDGSVCTVSCVDLCPAGWTCTGVEGLGADLLFVCVPRRALVCEPCSTVSECRGQSACALPASSYGTGMCLHRCDADAEAPCPRGFLCESRPVLPGPSPETVCVPEPEGGCCATATAGAFETCVLANAHGSCRGARRCEGEEGWGPCIAQLPAGEVCDRLDNDCDGRVDEDLGAPCLCGDGRCDTAQGENPRLCAPDCAACGDGVCSPGESPTACFADCCGGCGDGRCLGYACGEDPEECPADCGTACGDGTCDKGESPRVCAEDCTRYVCGNGECEPTDGGPEVCPGDCGSTCGNCICEGGEGFLECPTDCGYCGDGVCSPCDHLGEAKRCPEDCRDAPLVSGCDASQEGCVRLEGRLAAVPPSLTFTTSEPSMVQMEVVRLVNAGDGATHLTGLTLEGDSGFDVRLGQRRLQAGSSLELDPPLLIGSQHSVGLRIAFLPSEESVAEAVLTIFGDAPNAIRGITVLLRAVDPGGPCLEVKPASVDLGARLAGGPTGTAEVKLLSCGEVPLRLESVRLSGAADAADPELRALGVGESSSSFILGMGDDVGLDPLPLSLPRGRPFDLEISYAPPAEPSPSDDQGVPIPERAWILVESDSPEGVQAVEASAFAVSQACPTAVIEVAEGLEVTPQTVLHLDGSRSTSPDGAITGYEWSVEQPEGSVSGFLGGASNPRPTFEVNVAGSYTFALEVRDETGAESCAPARAVVDVRPDQAIHVELLWDTPADPDQSDQGPEAGADLDLHFLHPFAAGQDVDEDGEPDGWFDNPFDCFWFNPRPDWGSHDPEVHDNPGLDRDDTDGAGPENLNLNLPEDGSTYRVGVHVWNDHGFGASFATVRIFINGHQVWVKEGVKLENHDMWWVATIDWPSQTVAPTFGSGAGGLKIVPDYEHPAFHNQ